MFKIKGKINTFELQINRYTEYLDKQVQIQMREAARQWLRALILHTPVWTGTARGTLKPLANFLRVAIPIKPIAKRPGKGPSAGEGKATFEFGRSSKGIWFFEFDQQLTYFLINDYYDVSNYIHLRNPSPWKGLETAAFSFNSYIQNQLRSSKDFPKAADFVLTRTLDFGY